MADEAGNEAGDEAQLYNGGDGAPRAGGVVKGPAIGACLTPARAQSQDKLSFL